MRDKYSLGISYAGDWSVARRRGHFASIIPV